MTYWRNQDTLVMLVVVFVVISAADMLGDNFEMPLFKRFGGGGERPADAVTKVNSDSLELVVPENMATFTGNVFVNDPQVTISCHKMRLFFESDDAAESASAAGKTTEDGERGPGVSRILCLGDVIVIPRNDDKEKQRAMAGRVEYVKSRQEFVLTEHPVLMKGDKILRGKTITFSLKDQRLKVEGGSEFKAITNQSKEMM